MTLSDLSFLNFKPLIATIFFVQMHNLVLNSSMKRISKSYMNDAVFAHTMYMYVVCSLFIWWIACYAWTKITYLFCCINIVTLLSWLTIFGNIVRSWVGRWIRIWFVVWTTDIPIKVWGSINSKTLSPWITETMSQINILSKHICSRCRVLQHKHATINTIKWLLNSCFICIILPF